MSELPPIETSSHTAHQNVVCQWAPSDGSDRYANEHRKEGIRLSTIVFSVEYIERASKVCHCEHLSSFVEDHSAVSYGKDRLRKRLLEIIGIEMKATLVEGINSFFRKLQRKIASDSHGFDLYCPFFYCFGVKVIADIFQLISFTGIDHPVFIGLD